MRDPDGREATDTARRSSALRRAARSTKYAPRTHESPRGESGENARPTGAFEE
jgi:hypothetical protein